MKKTIMTKKGTGILLAVRQLGDAAKKHPGYSFTLQLEWRRSLLVCWRFSAEQFIH